MTIRTKRRGRRSLAAILAAMLMASVLAVVAGSPVQAANTSGEYLVDHDNDASTAAVREFAGRDRYDTSLRLAKRFADDRGGIGSVANAFLASGESLVDAVSVSGLAGFMDAPVLLTPSSNLHGGVADFIEDYGIANIYVLGGTGAISDGVVDGLEALANSPSVERIAGDDRYATSAAIASNLVGESWCGTNDNSAIVASGANDALFDAVAIGPVANRLELPVLLTAGDELVDAVLSYIETEDVEHVMVVGGTGNVSEAVEAALSTAGVDTVERIGGDSAAATSVAIAEVIGGACADDLSPVSDNTVSLVNRESLADGISAAPVLADDADQLGGGLIPILAVGDTLPASVRDYLAATPQERADGTKVHMRVLAIGGTAAVSDSVMSAAVDAAASADALTVTIGTADDDDGEVATDENDYVPGTKTPVLIAARQRVTLYFSDDVTQAESANLRNKLEDILFVNGVPADIQDDGTEDEECEPDSVTVTLANALNAGDTVSVTASATTLGAQQDLRPVQPAEATVPAAAVDRQRPSIRIVAIIGHDVVYALVNDNAGLASKGLLTGSLTDASGNALFEVTAPTARKDIIVTPTVPDDTFLPADGPAPKSVIVTFALANDESTTDVDEGIVRSTDRFRANRGAVEDTSGNESQVTTGVPVRPVSKLSVSSVLMSNLNHTAQAQASIPSSYAGQDPPPTVDGRQAAPYMQLVALKGGAADGALGNGWQIRADRSSSWDPDKDVDIDVFVSTKDRRIVVRYVNGSPKFADLKAALEANSTVNSLFEVRIDNAYVGGENTCRAANNALDVDALQVNAPAGADPDPEAAVEGDRDDVEILAGGTTKARISVNFNGWVEAMDAGQTGRLLSAVLADTRARAAKVGAIATQTVDDETTPLVDELDVALQTALLGMLGEFNEAGDDQQPRALAAQVGPTRAVSVDIVTQSAAALPSARDIVDLPDGFRKITYGTNRGKPFDADTTSATNGIQRTDEDFAGAAAADSVPAIPAYASNSIANGYGDTGVEVGDNVGEDDFNYGSKSRIATSSSVEAPK